MHPRLSSNSVAKDDLEVLLLLPLPPVRIIGKDLWIYPALRTDGAYLLTAQALYQKSSLPSPSATSLSRQPPVTPATDLSPDSLHSLKSTNELAVH